MNKYEREVAFLSTKNAKLNAQIKELLTEREEFHRSAKDIQRELVEKTRLCEELKEKLDLAEKSA